MQKRYLAAASAASIFIIIAIARFYYVNQYAVALPFWDQWDAEGDFLLRPWIEGSFRLTDLWNSHNEHRIFPTRILSLLIFSITGEWNNLTEARINVLLAACIPATITWLLVRKEKMTLLKWLILTVIIAQFALPFAFENLLVGFQSQFYFLILFTVAALVLVSYAPAKSYSIPAALLLCVLSVVTMASGILTPLAVTFTCILKSYTEGNFRISALAKSLIFIAVAVGGYFTIPNLGVNDQLKSQNFSELFEALQIILGWPYPDADWAMLLWLPGLSATIYLLIRRQLSPTDLFMVGCYAWSFLQALAIAYGRGHGLHEVSSRYAELFTLGLISNAWSAVRLGELATPRPLSYLSLSFFVLLLYGHADRYQTDMEDVLKVYKRSLAQVRNVTLYLTTGKKSALDQPTFEIPYPDANRLEQLLNNPTLRAILPRDLEGKQKRR